MNKSITFVILLLFANLTTANPLKVNIENLDSSYAIDYIKYSDGKREIQYLKKDDVPNDSSSKIIDCRDPAAAKLKDFNSIWLWNTDKIIREPTKAVLAAKDLGINMIYVQLIENMDRLNEFIEIASRNNIKITALGGEPDYIHNWNGIDRDLMKIKEYNLNHANKISGIQYDIEPHTLGDFSLNKNTLLQKYISTIEYINNKKGNLEFSVVVPFWYSEIKLNNELILDSIYKNVDYVTTMSYRTNYEQILDITNNSLCIASKYNKKLQIGIEHLHLSDEKHYTILKDDVVEIAKKNDGYIFDDDVSNLISRKYIQNYNVNSSNISFRGNEYGLRNILKTHPEYLAFKGWAVNGIVFDDN